ncbi:MAG: phosphoribosylanthranilate isomerase, partial [Notoacmeibacter sp.]|nr:phosphoribosylanthranilate isomerase [Notoacmeibacter sp.]
LPLDGGGRAGGAGGGGTSMPPTPALRADPPHRGEGERSVLAVAVTVDADDAYLDQIVAMMKPDMLQLHGKETPERVAELKARYQLPVMKAFAISTAEDLGKIAPYKGIADRFLFDAKPPKGSELPGGNAVSFDWSLLKALEPGTDYLLSGGIDAANVADAVTVANPPGLDLSSGVESAPGVKDVGKIGAFFEAVKAVC